MNKMFHRKNGSALILSIIVVMIMVILCSTIMTFTLANFRMSADYKKVIGGYYSSEENLEKGLKELQDRLYDFDQEANNYILTMGFKRDAFPLGDAYKPFNKLSNGYKYFVKTGDSDFSGFYHSTQLVFNAVYDNNSNGTGDGYTSAMSSFLQDVYRRYYFLLVYKAFGKAFSTTETHLVVSTPVLPTGSLDSTYGDYFVGDNVLASTNSTFELNFAEKTGATGDKVIAKICDYGDYSPSGTPIFYNDATTDNKIDIVYVKNSAKDKVKETNIHTTLDLKIPQVNFTISKSKINVVSYTGKVAAMGNAITCYKNVIVKDGATPTIDGDLYAGGQKLDSSNVAGINSILGKSGSGADTEYDDKDSDANEGGVRIGTKGGTSADTKLTINGTLYSDGNVHTISKNAKLDVNNYSGGATPESDKHGARTYIKRDSTGLGLTTNIYTKPFSGEVFTRYNEKGGDVFCKRLATEEAANNSRIKVSGRLLVDSNVEADAPLDTLAPYSIDLEGDCYGFQPIGGVDQHSVVVQNDPTASIKLHNFYIPGVAKVRDTALGGGATEDYQTAESITTSMDATLQAYENGSDYLKYIAKNVSEAIPGAVPGGDLPLPDQAKYLPFKFYDIKDAATNANAVNDVGGCQDPIIMKKHHFLSYFKEKVADEINAGTPVPRIDLVNQSTGGIEVQSDSIGYARGVAVIKSGSKTQIWSQDALPTALPSPSTTPRAVLDTWYDGNQANPVYHAIPTPTSIPDSSQPYYYWRDAGIRTDVYNNVFVKRTHDDYYGASGNLLNANFNSDFSMKNTVTDITDNPNLLIIKKTGTSTTLHITKDASTGESKVDECSDFTGPFTSGKAGVLITDRDVVIGDEVNYTGAIITTGNIIFKGSATITYKTNDDAGGIGVKDVFDSYPIAGKILGATANINSSSAGDITIKNVYHTDAGKVSRFTRTEWKKEN